MILYKIYSFCIALPLFVLDTIFTSLASAFGTLFPNADVIYTKVVKWWGKKTCKLFLLPITTEGLDMLDEKQSYVFIANHQGYLDIFLCYGYLNHDIKWMMKEYLKKIPFVGWACEKTRQVFVGDSRSSIQDAIEQSKQTLQSGMSMVIFPEGTRTHDGKMQEFKRGAFMLANDIELPIVPLTIKGSYEAFSRTAKSVSRHRLTLIAHKPITVEERKGKPTKQLMQEVFDIVNSDL